MSGPVMRPKPDIIVAELIRVLAEDASIRSISLKALERSKYDLNFDRPKIERKFGRLLYSYSIGLRSSSGHHSEIYTTKLLRKHSGLVAAGIFRTILPDIDLQLKMANLVNQSAENDSIISHEDNLDIADSIKTVETFLFSGEAFVLLKRDFNEFVEAGNPGVAPNDSDQACRQDGSLPGEVRSRLKTVSFFRSIKRKRETC